MNSYAGSLIYNHQKHTTVTLINAPVSFPGALSLTTLYVNTTVLLQPGNNMLHNQTIALLANISQEERKCDSESYTNERCWCHSKNISF